jgi:cytochrome d ubiquinol oxidase subunit II
MELTTIWFGLITILWIGYLVLEGFDFGVGVLLPIVGRTEPERRTVLRTIGPLWDGNEVWLLVAGGATFAAFPLWYATLFSGFYLALFLILVSLIVRNVGIEFRNKRPEPAWRARWDAAIFVTSLLTAVLWGVALANIVAGVPIDAQHHFTGDLLTLLNPYALLGGLTTLGLFVTHGALFLALKTDGALRQRANRLAGRIGLVAAVLAVLFLGWTQLSNGDPGSLVLSIVAAAAFVGALAANWRGHERWAFAASAVTIALAVVALFLALFPDVLPSTTDPAFSLTTTNASSTDYTLGIMTVVAVIFTPLVLLYQGWTYWIFRRRLATPAAEEAPTAAPATGEAT